ncbi:diacylglycerol/lipid kinase family protein [Actinopolyspora saharensis]|uniref:diacylglycerol/lipid kinase family protein n=1 Tax=Actinopolyspora saharensis TaxID=995062 RepID=UPI003F668020
MRAVLVVNPEATSTSSAGRDVLAHALASQTELELVETRYRGHAADTGSRATREDLDLVVVHGGDGTVNEVVNGMLDTEPTRAEKRPSLAVIPGGSANVFAGALGVPRDPLEATHRLLHAVEQRRGRWVGLGRANGRWFTFNAGVGIDADVVAEVERLRDSGRKVTPWLYARAAMACYLSSIHCEPLLTVHVDGEDPVTGGHAAMISNADPWTYLGPRAVHTNPETSFDTGIGVFVLRSMLPHAVSRHVAQMLRDRAKPHGKTLFRRANTGHVRVVCQEPLRVQVDGDSLGELSTIDFESVPNALHVVE